MTVQKLLRDIHHWGSTLVMIQLGLVISTGLLLMLKKDIDWIQPSTQAGEAPTAIPSQRFDALFETAKGVPELAIDDWRDLDRVDVKPGKGVIKFIATNNWEAQIDTETGAVLQVAYRRSDIIEQLHDGSFFADWVKLFVFLPTGVVLLVLWGTGVYLFFLPHVKRELRRRKRAAQAASRAA